MYYLLLLDIIYFFLSIPFPPSTVCPRPSFFHVLTAIFKLDLVLGRDYIVCLDPVLYYTSLCHDRVYTPPKPLIPVSLCLHL